MDKPKVTVYMPCFNYATFVEEAINSVIEQTFVDWELIVINDGSTDDSARVLDQYAEYDKMTIVHQENKGLNVTNNIALRAAQGEFLMRLDADDYLHPHSLGALVECLERNTDVGLVFPDYYEVDKNGQILRMVKNAIQDPKSEQLRDRPAHGACTMFRKSVLQRIGGYSEKYRRQDGYDIWLKVIEQFKPMNLDLPLFYYRQHGKSITDNMPKLLGTRREIVADHAEKKAQSIKVQALIPVNEHSLYEGADPLSILNGRPLIEYTLEEIRQTERIESVVVSTNHEGLKSYLTEKHPGIRISDRPEDLSMSQSHLFEKLVSYAFEEAATTSEEFDAICLLPVNAVLRKAEHIDWAINSMILFGTDVVYAVEENASPFFYHDKNGLRSANMGEGIRIERDSLYRDTGVLYLYHKQSQDPNRSGELLRGHITLLPSESVRINSDFERRMSELILLGEFET